MILIETDRIDPLREKFAAIGIDQPEYAVALANAEEAASAEVVVDDPSPFRSSQARLPATVRSFNSSHGPAPLLDLSQYHQEPA
jgi:hypothetical protein